MKIYMFMAFLTDGLIFRLIAGKIVGKNDYHASSIPIRGLFHVYSIYVYIYQYMLTSDSHSCDIMIFDVII